MIEILKVIILACQVHPGHRSYLESSDRLYEKQLNCRIKLIECVTAPITKRIVETKLIDCLSKEVQ